MASSIFFKLSPEVRCMIYSYILVDSDTSDPLQISQGCFSPKDSFEGRPGRRALFSYTCGRPLYSFREFCEHAENRFKSYCVDFRPLNPCTQKRHRMPSIPVGLLRTCRLIRAEATPILYMRNVFHFHDALSLHRFRRNTASEAEAVEEISLRPVDDDPWSDYICGSNPDTPDRKLRRDFPKLRRLVINLADRIEPPEETEEPLYQDFARHITGLDWVHITGIDDDPSSLLKSMVCRTPSSEDSHNPASSEVESVQVDTRNTMTPRITWKHITLWRGSPGSCPPHALRRHIPGS